ncbi:MAG: short-chain dehydrogenase [Candidatus Hydrogenedentota bacterium]
MLLKSKTAIITGAGRGIGRGIAVAFAQQGCDVAILARSVDELEVTAGLVRDAGRAAVVLPCDLSDAGQALHSGGKAVQALGHVDILVNNAGYASFKPFVESPVEEWRRTFDVNVFGVVSMIQAVLPSMIERKAGRIINISSVAGLKPISNQSSYVASKHALNGLTKVLSMELRESGIRVHSVCPGGVDTRLAAEAMPERDRSNWMTPEDVAHACLFLATQSERAHTDEIVVRRFESVPIGG